MTMAELQTITGRIIRAAERQAEARKEENDAISEAYAELCRKDELIHGAVRTALCELMEDLIARDRRDNRSTEAAETEIEATYEALNRIDLGDEEETGKALFV